MATALHKLLRYQKALREWRRGIAKGNTIFHEPTPGESGLKRVEEIFCAKKVRAKVMEETYTATNESQV